MNLADSVRELIASVPCTLLSRLASIAGSRPLYCRYLPDSALNNRNIRIYRIIRLWGDVQSSRQHNPGYDNAVGTVQTYAGHARRNLVSRIRSASADSADLHIPEKCRCVLQLHLIGKPQKIVFEIYMRLFVLRFATGRQRCLIFRHIPNPSAGNPFLVFQRFHLLRSVLIFYLPAAANYSSHFLLRSPFDPCHFFLAEPFSIPQPDCQCHTVVRCLPHTHLPVMILLQVFLDIYKGPGA